MDYLEKIKKVLQESSEKLIKTTEIITEKVKKVGEEGAQISKELIDEISEKTSEIAKIATHKLDLTNLEKDIDNKYQHLGKLVVQLNASRNKEKTEALLINYMAEIDRAKREYDKKSIAYNSLRKAYSGNYMINKLSDQLAESNATIDQVLVSEKSSAAAKTLKEISLPKNALITAIKRGKEIIIPDGNTRLMHGDSVTVIGKKGDVQKVLKQFSEGK